MELLLETATDPADFMAARTQMAFTLGFHIILASISIGLPALVLLAEWRWLRTGDPVCRELARRWIKCAAVLFAVGAVSGTVLSFEMGTLWPGFMDTYGQVFGLAFTLEGVAFFIEAIFMGIYIYGWDRLPPTVHLLTGVPIVLGGLFSAFFVVTVNAWMNQPQGFTLRDGEVVDVRPLEAMFNPATPTQATHLILASLMVCGFVVASVYAGALLRDRRRGADEATRRYHRRAFAIPFTLGAVCAPLQVLAGDWASRFVSERQPVKFAAMEGVEHTEAGVPFTFAFIEVPNALSLLLHLDAGATIQGLDAFPEDVRPPDGVVHLAFQIMIAMGLALLALAAYWAFIRWRGRRDGAGGRTEQAERALPRWFLWAATGSGAAASIAMLAGWTVTEVGRQPWIVYGEMLTADAVNPAPGLRYGLYVVLAGYTVLGIATVSVLRRLRRKPQRPQQSDRSDRSDQPDQPDQSDQSDQPPSAPQRPARRPERVR